VNKKDLSERDICTKFITPALTAAGWDINSQVREQVFLTDGQVIVRGRMVRRGERKFADYVLFYKPNIPIAVVEAKDNTHRVGDGMQQALTYAEMLGVPSVYSSNGDGFLEHDRSGQQRRPESELSMAAFPSPDELWKRYCTWKGISGASLPTVTQDYYPDAIDKSPRYYQARAINATVEAIAKGQDRVLLVMATGTGKTYTAFQIIWRLWKAGIKKRILFLADRDILLTQTKNKDFSPFGPAMHRIKNRQAEKSYEIYLALYQAISGNEESQDIFKQFSPGFFDLIVVDECHRGSANANSAWREILEYFSSPSRSASWRRSISSWPSATTWRSSKPRSAPSPPNPPTAPSPPSPPPKLLRTHAPPGIVWRRTSTSPRRKAPQLMVCVPRSWTWRLEEDCKGKIRKMNPPCVFSPRFGRV
jgi:type I restriction enzyme R subunit